MKYVSPQIARDFKSTFLSCETDQALIWKKLFFENRPYSEYLKRLLVINNPDCLDMDNAAYADIVKKYPVDRLFKEKYISTVPKFSLKEFEELKSYIRLEFDDFIPTKTNPQFRDSVITFTILSHFDTWELDDYKLRPIQIAGYIDGIMDKTKLSGIGTLNFMGAGSFVLDENLGGIMLRYMATHGSDDKGAIVE